MHHLLCCPHGDRRRPSAGCPLWVLDLGRSSNKGLCGGDHSGSFAGEQVGAGRSQVASRWLSRSQHPPKLVLCNVSNTKSLQLARTDVHWRSIRSHEIPEARPLRRLASRWTTPLYPNSKVKLPCRTRYVPIFQPAHIIPSITHSTLVSQWHTPLQVHRCSGRSCTHSAPTYPHSAACQRLCSSSVRVSLHLLIAFIRISCLLASMRSSTARLCSVVLLVRVFCLRFV